VPEWASTLLAVAVGAGLTGITGFLTIRWQLDREDKRRAEDALRDRRERGAAAVGPVRLLVGEAEPTEWMMWAGNPGVDENWVEVLGRWRALREPLAVYAAGHPSSEISEVATRVMDAVAKSLGSTRWGMLAVVREPQPDLTPLLKEAQRDHAEAVKLADELLRLVREEGAP
jgi:hypothetical protein